MAAAELGSAQAAGGATRSVDVLRLYFEFSGELEQIVRAACGPRVSVEDACQTAWTRLVRHRHRVDPDRARAWLGRTAVRAALRLDRKRDRECALEFAPLEEVGQPRRPPAPTLDEVLAHRELIEALGALPVRQQRLVWLRMLGLSYEEMASYERCTHRTVHRQLDRARRRLRDLQGDELSFRAAA